MLHMFRVKRACTLKLSGDNGFGVSLIQAIKQLHINKIVGGMCGGRACVYACVYL